MTTPEQTARLARIIAAARQRRIGRRDFMQGALATGATAALASGLWTSKVQAQTPQRGGTFRVGINDGATSDQLDPAQTATIFEIQISHCLRSFLTEITPDNELGPDLSTGWEALSDDARTWRFEIAQGVTFHSGRELRMQDIIASLNHHRGESSTSAAKTLLENVTDIRADGDNAIVIELSQGTADMPYLLSDYHLQICPAREDGTIDWESGDGTGPYALDAFEPGVEANLSRHEGWHREGAWFDALRLLVINDSNARQTALVTSQIDAVTEADLRTVSLLERADGVVIDNIPSATHITFPMFCDQAPFDDVNVRLALKYAIDREDIVQRIMFGYATVGNDVPIGRDLPYWSEFEQRTYDPDRARFHLREAGMENLSVDLSSTDSFLPNAVDMAVLFAEQASQAGININVVREPADGYWSNVWLQKPFVTASWGTRPTPDVLYSLAYAAGADWNESHWRNERFNELLVAAKSELDQELRQEMYTEMHGLCRDDGGTIVPFFRNRVMARRDNVMHDESIASNWELDGARGYHRWWFAS